METMVNTNDGFKIAERLKLRGREHNGYTTEWRNALRVTNLISTLN